MEGSTRRRPTRSTLRLASQSVEAQDDQVFARVKETLDRVLAERRTFEGRVELWIDDDRGLIIDGSSRRTEPGGGPADCRIYMHPRELKRLIEGAIEPRQAILFGRMVVRDGDRKAAVRFGDALANRVSDQSFRTNRPLPTPTRDLQRAREDLETFGYALVEGAMPPEQVREVRARIVEQAAAEREFGVAHLGEATQTVWSLLNKGEIFHKVLHNPLIDAFVPDVLDDYAVLTGIVSQIAMPGNTSSTMHFDQTYVQPDVRHFPIGLNFLWFLDDVSEANGGTRLMPGSHTHNVAPADPFDIEGTVAAEGPAGTCLILDSRVWHSVGPNRTDRKRHLLVTYFNRSFMRTQENYFLSLRPEVEANLDERVRVMCGFRCTGSLGAVEGPVEGAINRRLENPVGELYPSQPVEE